MLIEIENNLERNLRFQLDDYFCEVDPNSIFSKEGIKKSQEEFSRSSFNAIAEAFYFGQQIIRLIPGEAKCIISLLNNTAGLFSVTEYAAGNSRSADSRKVFIHAEQDPDDFFLTTNTHLYEKIR